MYLAKYRKSSNKSKILVENNTKFIFDELDSLINVTDYDLELDRLMDVDLILLLISDRTSIADVALYKDNCKERTQINIDNLFYAVHNFKRATDIQPTVLSYTLIQNGERLTQYIFAYKKGVLEDSLYNILKSIF